MEKDLLNFMASITPDAIIDCKALNNTAEFTFDGLRIFADLSLQHRRVRFVLLIDGVQMWNIPASEVVAEAFDSLFSIVQNATRTRRAEKREELYHWVQAKSKRTTTRSDWYSTK